MPRFHGDEDADREERRQGRKLRAAYYTIIGDAPALKAGDHQGAADYLRKIRKARVHGGWTRREWARLYALEKKWMRRANGQDAHFEIYGNTLMRPQDNWQGKRQDERTLLNQVAKIREICHAEIKRRIKDGEAESTGLGDRNLHEEEMWRETDRQSF